MLDYLLLIVFKKTQMHQARNSKIKVRKSNPALNRSRQVRLRRDMSEKSQKQRDNESKAYDVILIFVTAFAAPLAVHVCDVTMGKENNPLSSEKLLCAYFALIAAYVIYEFLLSYYKQTRLWDRGWKFGNSDALIFFHLHRCSNHSNRILRYFGWNTVHPSNPPLLCGYPPI